MKQTAPPDTASALLHAARRLFANHGFDGASVRAITSAADANLGAITYHFGTKRKLYEKVLETSTAPLADAAVSAAETSGTPGMRVAAVVRAYFEVLADDPDLARIMMQHFVIGKAPAATNALPIRRIQAALSALVSDGQALGEFRAGDPKLMAMSIISLPVHMNLIRLPLKALGFDFDDPQTREALIQHVIAFACAGLAHRTEP